MVISGVRQKYYQNNVTAAKKLYGVGNLEKRAQTTGQQTELLDNKITKEEFERSRLTAQKTNEVAWEHYTAMRGISSQTLKSPMD